MYFQQECGQLDQPQWAVSACLSLVFAPELYTASRMCSRVTSHMTYVKSAVFLSALAREAGSGLVVATDAARTALPTTRATRAKRKKKVLPNIMFREQ